MLNLLPVTQADRDLAADLHHWYNGQITAAEEIMRAGHYDDDDRVQMVARFRLSHSRPGEGMREALAAAYMQGATDVHTHWLANPGEAPRGDPEFGEAASDYATAALDPFDSSARAALTPSALSGDAGEGDRSIADDLRYLEEAEAHADEGPLGEPAARSILKIALRLARKANDTGNPIAPGCPRASRLHAPLRFCPDCPEGDSCELPAQQGGR